MHELPLTNEILEAALEYAEARGAKRIVRICLEVGELREFADEHMGRQFVDYFNYLSRHTPAEGATLEVRPIPVVVACPKCDRTYLCDPPSLATPPGASLDCPKCGNDKTKLVSGAELRLTTVETE